jgi:hypothetical protein
LASMNNFPDSDSDSDSGDIVFLPYSVGSFVSIGALGADTLRPCEPLCTSPYAQASQAETARAETTQISW